MKKIFPALLTVSAIAAAGAGLYLAQKPGGLRWGADKLMVADYLPAETLVLLALPDPGKTGEDWKTTDLYKIWTEPQVQAFLAKPLSKIPQDQNFEKIRAQIAAVNPTNLFVAMTAFDEATSQPHVVGGFRFKGSKDDLEKLLAAPKKALRDAIPAGKADLTDYQGHAIESYISPDKTVLAAAYLGDWCLIANDVALLKSTIDRVDRRAPESAAPLSKDPDYQTVGTKLPGGYETLIYARPKMFVDRVYALATASGQVIDDETRAESGKLKAIGATTSFEGGKIRDTIYVLAPGLKQDKAHLQMSSLPLSSTDTLFYLASAIQWPAKLNLPRGSGADASAMAPLQGFLDELGKRGITIESLHAALGDEAGVELNWPASSMQPSLQASVKVRDHAAAQKMVEQFTSQPFDELAWEKKQAGGQTYYTITLQSLSLVQPTLALTDKHLIVGLDPAQVRDAVEHQGGDKPNFSTSDAYKGAYALVDKPNVTFAYLDTKGMFERTYGLLRPYAMLSAAFLPPQNTEYVDLSRLPDTESISKHLSPSVLSQTLDKDGVKLDSVGSVTFAQGVTTVGGLAGVAAATVFAKDGLDKLVPGLSSKLGLPTPPAAADPSPGPTASPTPEASPAATPNPADASDNQH